MKTVIMAGGKGTRISSVASDIPKPMIKIDRIPVLEREIEGLRKQGLVDLIITVSHLGNVIMDYFGDGSGVSPITGKPFGVHISYYIEEEPLGNAGALFRIREQLTDDFFLLNADAVFDIDFHRLIRYHKSKGAWVTLFTHPNSHPYDSGVLVADSEGKVLKWFTKEESRPEFYKNRVNAGLHVISPKLLVNFAENRNGELPSKIDLDRMLLKPLAGTGKMYCYDSPEYIKDMGTPERYQAVCEDFKSGIVSAKNLCNRQKAFFLDRDGTINRYVGFLKKLDDFELLPKAAEAIRMINSSGYLAIVVTNQPVIARGEVTREYLDQIHDKMETLLGREGAYIDALYYCPHHPNRGFAGEVSELKIECDCRKPKPGMLLQAAKDYNIDFSESYMIGDSITDVQAGIAAGCKSVLIGSKTMNQYDGNIGYASDLLQAVKQILRGGSR